MNSTFPNREQRGRDDAVPRSRQDFAYLHLRDLIVTGRLPPGATLIELQLAEQLDLTRTLVRAALRRLELEGYVNAVVLNKYSRTVVAPLTAETVRELFPIMGCLEGLAMRNAAGLDDDVRRQIADEMQELNDALRAAAADGNVVHAQNLHVRFHTVSVEAAAGPLLFAQIDRIQHQVERYERLYTHVLITGIEDSVKEHADMIAALCAGEPDAAQLAAEINWRRGAERYERALSHGFRRGPTLTGEGDAAARRDSLLP